MNHHTMTASPPPPAVSAAYRHCETVTGRHARNYACGIRLLPATRRRALSAVHAVGLYPAGAWTATGWPATVEGAVRSGLAAARAAT